MSLFIFNLLLPLTTPDSYKEKACKGNYMQFFLHCRNPTPDDSLGFTWQPATADDLLHLSLTPTPAMKDDTRKKVRFVNLFIFLQLSHQVNLKEREIMVTNVDL